MQGRHRFSLPIMRGKKPQIRAIAADAKYKDTQVAKFINHLMRNGKKSVAQAVVYQAFEIIAEKSKKNPLEIFELALKHVSPVLEVKSRRVGGANYQIPTPVRGERRFFLAVRWLLTATKGKKGRSMHEKLADELLAASNGEGDAVKKREDVQRMAEANRAFAHFAR